MDEGGRSGEADCKTLLTGGQPEPESDMGLAGAAVAEELSPNFGDGLRVQAAAVWACEDAGLAATSIPSVNLTP